MTCSSGGELEVPSADPRRRARGAAGSGTEAAVLWWPTRGYPAKGWVQAARFRVPARTRGCRRKASEGRSGERQYVPALAVKST